MKRTLAISLVVLAVGCSSKKQPPSETASGSATPPPPAAPAPVEPAGSAGSAPAPGSSEPAPPAPGSAAAGPPFTLPPGGKPAKPRSIDGVMTGDGTAYKGSNVDVGEKVLKAAKAEGWKCDPPTVYPITCKKDTQEIKLRLAVNSDIETVLYISGP